MAALLGKPPKVMTLKFKFKVKVQFLSVNYITTKHKPFKATTDKYFEFKK